jgi:hypothetical protein
VVLFSDTVFVVIVPIAIEINRAGVEQDKRTGLEILAEWSRHLPTWLVLNDQDFAE